MNIPCSNPCPRCDTPAPGTRGAPNPNDPQNPLVNLSSEAPDKDNFIGHRWGLPPDGDYWPPLGRNWYSIGCVGFCVSDVSQAEADICAANQAVECTSNNWPPVVVVDPNVEPPVVDPQPGTTYSNDEQTGYFTCPDGSQNRYEVPAGSFEALSKAAADAIAYAYAVEQAAKSYICIGDISPSRCCSGSAYSASITVVTPLTVSISVAGALPPGLSATVEGSVVTISGTPAASGQFTFRIVARESSTNTVEKLLTISVVGIQNDSTLPSATTGSSYSNYFVMDGPDIETPTWSVSGGALPSGLTLNAATGLLSGTPTSTGTSIFYVRAVSGSMQCTKVFSLTVAEQSCITNGSTLAQGQVSAPYSVTLTPAGTPSPGMQFIYSVVSGALPDGLALGPETGAITGTPAVEGPFSFCVQVVESPVGGGGGEP